MEALGVVGPSKRLPKHTNHPLTEVQKREIQGLISIELEDIGFMDARMLQLQSALDDLKSRHSVKQGHVTMLKIFVSPIKELPNEIISRIFRQYAYEPYSTHLLLSTELSHRGHVHLNIHRAVETQSLPPPSLILLGRSVLSVCPRCAAH